MSDFETSALVAGTEWAGDSRGEGGKRRSWRWDDLRKLIEHPVRLATRDAIAKQIAGVPFWSFSYFADDKLTESNLERTHALVFQVQPDAGDPLASVRADWGDWSFLAYPSIAKRHRWIVVLPLAKPIADQAVFDRVVKWVVLRDRFEGRGGLSEAAVRRTTIGACRMPADAGGKEGAPAYEFHTEKKGDFLSVEDCLADLPRLEALAALEDWSLDRAAGLLTRHAHPGTAQTVFAWPGVGKGSVPKRKTDPEVDAAIAAGGQGPTPNWRRLAELVGLPRPDQLILLVGRTGCGKSAWALQVAETIARQGHPTLVISAEMGPEEVIARFFAQRAKTLRDGEAVRWRDLMTGRASQQGLDDAGVQMRTDCPHMYLWAPLRNQRSCEQLEQAVRRLVCAHGRAPFVVLDDLERFLPPGATEADRQRLTATLRDLCHVRADWPGAGVLLNSSPCAESIRVLHTTKALQDSLTGVHTRALAEDLVGGIAVDATMVLALAADLSGPSGDHAAFLGVFKDRAGGGEGGGVQLNFCAVRGRFEEIDDV